MYLIKSRLPDVKRRPIISLPKFTVGCCFRAEKYRSDGTITYRGPWFKNTVLNVGLDQLAEARSVIPAGDAQSATRFINVGTGTSTPATTDTGLTTWLAATNSTHGSLAVDYSAGDNVSSPTTPAWKSWQHTFAFAIGGCTGNLTELGLSNASNSSYFNRQLFRDAIGDPATITVLSDEGLRITVEVIVYAPLAIDEIASADFTVNSVSKTATIELVTGAWLTSTSSSGYFYPGWLREAGNSIQVATAAGSYVGADTVTRESYTSGNFYRDYAATFNPGTFTGDWKRIQSGFFWSTNFTAGYPFTITLADAITIADTEELTLTLRRSWGRV